MGIDSITLEVLWNRLQAIAHEMGTTLHRTAFSQMVRESHDYSCVVMDARGRGLGQSDHSIPSFASLLPQAAKRILTVIPAENFKPGDVVMSNDPWLGSTHLFDMTMLMPCFWQGRLVAFMGAIVHLPDIGGRGWSSDAKEIYEEGVRLTLVYYTRQGKLNKELLDVFFANVRTPDMVAGDLQAQAAALSLGARRLDSFFREYGLTDLTELSDQILDRGKAALQDAVAQIKEGTYCSEAVFDGTDNEPLTLKLTLTVSQGKIHADYTGSSPQTRSGLNCVLAYTYAYTSYALKCVLDPETYNNDGCYHAITVSAPKGCILNPEFPAAVAARAFAGLLLALVVLRAIARAAPERVLADGCVPPWLLQIHGRRDDASPFNLALALAGGQGASMHGDGLSSTSFPTNSSNVPVEVVEATTPLRIIEKSLLSGSGGEGRRRGGMGQRLRLRSVSSTPAQITIFAEQTRRPPQGLLGGKPGYVGRVIFNGADLTNSKGSVTLGNTDELMVELPGGGGFGPAEERESELAEADRLRG